jgi:hypothetical protein
MSKLDDAVKQHMTHIITEEHRPFSYRDFIHFEVDRIEHKMTHGTFRNKVSRLVKEGAVEHSYHSGLTFYTLKGIKFGKPMTPNHTGVTSHSHPVVKIIRSLPFDKSALHDIHLRLQVKGAWSLLSGSPAYDPAPVSIDIRLPFVRIDELRLRVTIHKTDTITVVVGCSYAPIAVDVRGIIRLSNALTRVEERLSRLLQDCSRGLAEGLDLGQEQASAVIPDHKDWVVTMWHFGADASIEYTGEKFSASWEIGQNELLRVYSKEFHGAVDERGVRTCSRNKTRIRVEMQEYPRTTVENAIKNIFNRGRFANY